MPDTEIAPPVYVARANIYLPREICDAYMPKVTSVALLIEDDSILVVPLMQESAGGLLLKLRNARGDRVIHAQEFFRSKGFVEDFEERTVEVHWRTDTAALVVSGIPRSAG